MGSSEFLSASGMYGLLRSLGLEPGGEFKAGIEEAEKIGTSFSLLPCNNNILFLFGACMHIQSYSV